MTTPQQTAGEAAVSTEDELLQLQLKVAQRADKLAQENGSVRGRDLQHWLQAEQDILERGAGLALAKA
jgi:hypothetical protein